VTLFGNDGNDSLIASGGSNVTMFGGDGNDSLVASGANQVTMFGNEGNDSIVATAGSNISIFGNDGNDSLVASGATQVTMFGGAGDDSLLASAGANVTVFGGDGNDSLTANGANQVTMFGNDGNDSIVASAGANVTIFGNDGDDSITASGANNVTIFGNDGNDSLIASAGTNVTMFGNEGNDSILATGGSNVTVFGNEGDDSLTATGGSNVTMFGNEGNDSLVAAGANQITMFGNDGDDTMVASAGSNVTIFGNEGNDSITATGANQVTIFGNEGNDSITATAGSNVTIFGNDGDDSITAAGANQVTIFGNDGNDSISATAGNNVTIFGNDGNDSILASGGSNVTIFGNDGDDSIVATGGSNVTVFGNDGNDSLVAAGGNNVTMFGNDGNDSIVATGGSNVTVFGNEGDDLLVAAGANQITMFGGDGNDTMIASAGSQVTIFGNDGNDSLVASGANQVTIFGGGGDDSITASAGTQVTIFGNDGNDSLVAAGANQVTMFGNEGNDSLVATAGSQITMFGNEGNDSLTTSAGDNVTLVGGTGDDTLAALAGNNVTLFGQEGNDSIIASSAGNQITVFGGDGNDTILANAGNNVTIFGNEGDDSIVAAGGSNVTIFGNDGNDTLVAAGANNVTMFGNDGNDSLLATAGNNVSLYGGNGDDTLAATGGTNVTLLGEAGNDSLSTSGADGVILFGGRGDDTLTAAAGSDIQLYGDDGNDDYVIDAIAGSSVVRLKEILYLNSDSTDKPTRGTDTIDVSQFFAITLAMNVYGAVNDPSVGLQALGGGRDLALYGGFENVIGTPGADLLIGNESDNKLVGNGGNDTLEGGAGDDTLVAGAGNDILQGDAGNDTYQFSAGSVGTHQVVESANADADTLDFSTFNGPVSVNLGSTAPQSLAGGQVVVTLSDAAGVENVVGSPFGDSIIGNARDNVIEGGPGNDTMAGGAGDDTYVFSGGNLGSDVINEAPSADSDTLDFSLFAAPLNIDLAQPGAQAVGGNNLTLTLGNDTAIENVVGTAFNDTILGNARDNHLYGAAGVDYIDGRAGNDYLQGDVTQVVLLDFDSRTDSGEHVYTQAERDGIQQRLQTVYAAFSYSFTQDPAVAQAMAKPQGGKFATIYFNDGSSSDGGGNSSQLDFGNSDRGGYALIDVNGFLGGAGEPDATSANYVLLSAEVAAHELGHLSGLHHEDSYGPIGSGIFAGVDPAVYLPAGDGPDLFTGLSAGVIAPPEVIPTGATETPGHVMASPASVGTTLFDATSDTFFGEREAIKLAFADGGTTVLEQPGPKGTAATAQILGPLPGLNVPNTLLSGQNAGQSFSVGAIAVRGRIDLTGANVSENDVYSFTGKAGDLMDFLVISADASPKLANPIDSVLRVYDSAGHELVANDDSLQSTDSSILDFALPADGVYYVMVDTFAGAFDRDVGDYTLFMSRFAVGPSDGLGDTVIGGSGSDTVVGGAGNDIFRTNGATLADHDVYFGGPGNDLLDLSAAPALNYTIPNNDVEQIKNADTPPVLASVSPLSGIEGQAITTTLHATDTDAIDRLTFSIAPEPGFAFPTGISLDATTGALSWNPPQDGAYGARVTVTDASGATDSHVVTFSIANAPPVVHAGTDLTTTEGSPVSLHGTYFDPGVLDAHTLTWSYTSTNGQHGTGSGADFAFTPQDDGIYAVTFSVTDDHVTISDTIHVTVLNAAPVANAGPNQTVNEGDTVSLSGSFTDAGTLDTHTYHWHVVASNGQSIPDGTSPMFGFTPNDNGIYTVTFTVTDNAGATGTSVAVVTVNNLPPTANAGSNQTVVESTPVHLVGTASDPGNDALTYLWHVVASNGQVIADGSGTSFYFTPQDDGSYAVLFKVTDKDGATANSQVTVTVTNAPPIVTAGGSASFGFGTPFTRSGSFTDPGLDTWTATVNYGDGSGTQPVTLNPDKTFNLAHDFPAGDFTVTVSVSDDDGGVGTASFAVHVSKATPIVAVSALNVAYDGLAHPATGTVTGLSGVPAATLEGVGLTFTYYAGTTAAGTPLSGAPTNTGTYTVVATFPGSADYNAASAQTTFTITGTISGHRYIDVTGNGLSSDDTPLAGGTLNLYRDSNNNGVLDTATDQLVATLTTAADGSYLFPNVTPGNYFVQEVVASGYVQTWPVSGYIGVTLAGNVIGKDFADFQLLNTSAVSNISYKINGTTTVTDLHGNTSEGDFVTATFTVAKGTILPLSLVSYTAPGATFDPNTANLQAIFDLATGTFGSASAAMTYSLTIQVPNSYFQIDLVAGPAIDHLGPAGSNIFYSAQSRLFSAANDGVEPFATAFGSLTGYAYDDTGSNNGVKESGEPGLAGVTITLTGTDYQGHAVSLSRITAADGSYSVKGLQAANAAGYTLTETAPAQFLTGINAAGTVNGNTVGTAPVAAATITGITLAAGNAGVNYNFADLHAVVTGDDATISFWNGKSGQALIGQLNGGSSSTKLAQWLATTFPNLYGPNAGSHAMYKSGAYLTNAQVASAYKNSFYTSGSNNTDAQVISAALSTYVTSTTLAGGSYAASYGFNVSAAGTGSHAYSVGSYGSVFGVVNNVARGVLQLLASVNSAASSTGVIANTTAVKAVFTGINTAGDIMLYNAGIGGSLDPQILIRRFEDLHTGTLLVYVDNSAGTITAEEMQRIDDAIATIDSELARYGVDLVDDSGDPSGPDGADVVIRMAATSDIGGAAQGVLGLTEMGGNITLISGWNWYVGSDPAGIGVGQYDFQTAATHELGHALGLGHSKDGASVMYPYLAVAAARHGFTQADLQLIDDAENNPEPLLALPAPAAQPPAGVILSPIPAAVTPPSPAVSVVPAVQPADDHAAFVRTINGPRPVIAPALATQSVNTIEPLDTGEFNDDWDAWPQPDIRHIRVTDPAPRSRSTEVPAAPAAEPTDDNRSWWVDLSSATPSDTMPESNDLGGPDEMIGNLSQSDEEVGDVTPTTVNDSAAEVAENT
jgi:Ca2+-binding RTX toxin-like protein